MTLEIVYEDKYLLVINKTAGISVNRCLTDHQQTIQDAVAEYRKIPPTALGGRAGIVHRLDKPTSGLLIVAKDMPTLLALQSLFKSRQIVKRYLALVHDRVEPEQGRIDAPISRNPFNPKRFGIFLGGRTAITEYRVEGFYQNDDQVFSLLCVMPKTGRTHQIRVHLKHINHSLVGDEQYAGRKTSRKDARWCGRLFLHASYLLFNHPMTGRQLELVSELPEDLQAVLANLRKIK